MKNIFLVRQIEARDVEAIDRLNKELKTHRQSLFLSHNKIFHKRKTPIVSESLKKISLSPDEVALCAETLDKEIIAFVWATIHERKGRALSRLGSIEELIVTKKFQRIGVAKKLLSTLIKELKKHGCDHITVHTDWENHAARKFYATYGMHEAMVEFWKKI